MTQYRYPESKLIDEVVFKTTARGARRAYLHAAEGADPAKLYEINCKLQELGFKCIPFTLEGKPALEVRDFKLESELTTCLVQNKWATGKAKYKELPEDKIKLADKLRKRSLQASGMAMAVADIGFIKYGEGEKRWEEAAAGFSYLAGSTALTLYGRNDQSDLQISKIANGMLQYAKEQGMVIPEDCAIASVKGNKPQGVLSKVNNFLRENPSEIGNMMYFVAGSLIAKSALQHRALAKPRDTMSAKQISEMRKGGWGDTLLGTSTMASGLLGTFVKEKARDPDKPRKKGLAGVWESIQEKPLTYAGFGYMVSTLCHAYTTYTDRKEALRIVGTMEKHTEEYMHATEKLKNIPWRMLFIGATLLGEVLLAISSKGHGEGVVSDTSVDKSVIALTADLIAKQPAHRQEHLIDYMAKFLGRPEVLAIKDEQAADLLRAEVEALKKNPWVTHTASAATTEIPAPPVKPAAVPAWQAKVALSEAAKSGPQLST